LSGGGEFHLGVGSFVWGGEFRLGGGLTYTCVQQFISSSFVSTCNVTSTDWRASLLLRLDLLSIM